MMESSNETRGPDADRPDPVEHRSARRSCGARAVETARPFGARATHARTQAGDAPAQAQEAVRSLGIGALNRRNGYRATSLGEWALD